MRIECTDLGKTYDGSAWAVRGLDLTIEPGAILGLIGPNGAGKSTALRMLATVATPTRGAIRYDGRPAPAKHDPEAGALRQRIGFLGDGVPLYKRMSPAEYLRFFGQCYGLRGAVLRDAIERTLITFDLVGRADTPAGQLSKGMRQRLQIARCLLHNPALLLLDEPADGLDPRGRGDLRRILRRAADDGVTVVISSHILRELDELCDTVAILQKGRLVVGGEVPAIMEHHDVARFAYALRILGDASACPAVFAQHRARIEGHSVTGEVTTLHVRIAAGDGRPGGSGDARMADMLAALVRAGVRVVTAAREQTRLEDVYERLSEDRVN